MDVWRYRGIYVMGREGGDYPMTTRFNSEKAGARHDVRPQREVELIKRAVRNANGNKDRARNMVLKALGVRSLDQLPGGCG
jgi:hypothetical protein